MTKSSVSELITLLSLKKTDSVFLIHPWVLKMEVETLSAPSPCVFSRDLTLCYSKIPIETINTFVWSQQQLTAWKNGKIRLVKQPPAVSWISCLSRVSWRRACFLISLCMQHDFRGRAWIYSRFIWCIKNKEGQVRLSFFLWKVVDSLSTWAVNLLDAERH